ncbi:MAG: IS1182 family transposase [Nitrospirota bacterium]
MAYVKSLKNQQWLLPPSIEELIPEDHICFLVESLVESMDYSSFDEKYSGPGHPAYHPRILLKLLIMGILDKIRSSRKLARCARENIAYMYLAEKLAPDFRTISDFRKDNPRLIKEAFKQTIVLAKKLGMVNLSCLSTDGTKIKASASNRNTLTKKEIEVLLGFVEGELQAWAQQDVVEDRQFKNLRGSDQLPEASKKKIQSLVKQYIEKTKERGNKATAKIKQKLKTAEEEMAKNNLAKVSTTDPESRFMPNKKKRIEFSYNAQITTDREGFVLACEATQDETDTNQLISQVEQTEQNLDGLPPGTKLNADNGYYSTENIEYAAVKAVDLYVPPPKKKPGPFSSGNFKYRRDADEFTCPNGNAVRFLSRRFDKTKGNEYLFYKAEGCQACPHQKACTRSEKGIRILKITPNLELRTGMERKMATEAAKETYKLRRQTVEPTIGDLKKHLGLEDFVLKGLKNANIELDLACAARNLKRVWAKQKRNNH